MNSPQGTPFPQLSDSPRSVALISAIHTTFLKLIEAQRENGTPPSKSFYNMGFVMLNLEVMGRDYKTYWDAFQRAQRDYGYTSLVWNKAFRSEDPIDQQEVMRNWGTDPEVLIIVQKIAMAVSEIAREDETWKPMDVIIWSMLTSMVDSDYHDPLMESLVRIIDRGANKLQQEEEDSLPLN